MEPRIVPTLRRTPRPRASVGVIVGSVLTACIVFGLLGLRGWRMWERSHRRGAGAEGPVVGKIVLALEPDGSAHLLGMSRLLAPAEQEALFRATAARNPATHLVLWTRRGIDRQKVAEVTASARAAGLTRVSEERH